MKTFSTFLRIVYRNRMVLLIYICVTIGISFAMSTSGNKADEVFADNRQPICIMDEDNSVLSRAFQKYMAGKHDLVELEDNEDVLQDAMYYGDIVYLIRIPKGFSLAVLEGNETAFDVTSAPDSAGGVYVSRQMESFVKTFCAYTEMGFDDEEALSKTTETLNKSTEVELISDNVSNTLPKFASFLQMMAYGLVSVLIHCIGSVMIAFNEQNVSKRIRCSSKSSAKINLQIVLGCLVIATVVFALFFGVAILVSGSELTEYFALKYLVMNSIAMTFAGVALGFFFGVISKHDGHISIFGVSISMAFSFLGGVFVPLSLMGDGVKKVSQFLPTYWYITNLESLLPVKAMTETIRTQFMQGIYIQLAFAAALIAIAFCISRVKSRPENCA